MTELIEYLNSLDVNQRERFAKKADTSVSYLRKAASIGQSLRPELCVGIERESNRQITRQMLRPTDWMRIWPELVEAA